MLIRLGLSECFANTVYVHSGFGLDFLGGFGMERV